MSYAYILCASEEDINKLKNLAENDLNIKIETDNNLKIVLEQKVVYILHKLGVSNNLKGYKLLKDTIMYYFENRNINNFYRDLYPIISARYNISVKTLDKYISRVIEKGWINADYDFMDKLFGSSIDIDKGTPTNKLYIMTIVEAINVYVDFKM